MTQRTVVILSFILFVAALFWGGITFLAYIGAPIHMYVYMLPNDVSAIQEICGSDTTLSTFMCGGVQVFWVFLGALLNMGSPFFAYILLSLAAFAGVLLWSGFKTGYFQAVLRVRPVYMIAAFFVSTFVLASTFALGTMYNAVTPDAQKIQDINGNKILPPFSRFFEPTEEVYGGAGPQALEELKKNYDSLLDRGCLSPLTNASGQELTTQRGTRIFNLSYGCMMQSFFGRAGLQMIMVLYFLFNLLVLGRFLLAYVLKMKPMHPLLFLCLCFGAGALGWIFLLWSLAILHILKPAIVRALFFGAPFLLFPWSLAWIKESWNSTFEVEFSIKKIHVVLAWLLVSYLALNFLNVVRPFPIGWDDLGSYLNRPRLLASYGYFIPTMSQFQWEYLTSLGFLIFGYDSWPGSTFAMQINWSAGLLAVLSIYAFGRVFLGRGAGVLAAILYYFLPMTGHFSFADMKIDNAVFFTSTLGVLALMVALFKSDDNDPEAVASPDWKMLFVSGALLSFAFAIKATAALSLFLAGSIFIGYWMGPLAFTGIAFAGFGILAKFGPLSINDIISRAGFTATFPQDVFSYGLLLIAVICLGTAAYRVRNQLKPIVMSLGTFVLGALVAFAPWALHNLTINKHLTVPAMLGASDTTSPQVFYEQKEDIAKYNLAPSIPLRTLPPELKLDANNAACKTSARAEELDRYWGFDKSLGHYLLLPWRQVMNIDAFGYYVTLFPALLLFPLLLLLPYFWSKEGRWLRILTAGTFIFIIQWAFVANGIIWYGIGMFIGLCVALEAFVARAPDNANKWLFAVLVACSIAVCLINRLWQFDQQKNIFEYPLGKITASALREVTIPDYDDIRESVVSRHETLADTPYTYRVGTFISYFIPKNREIFPLADHQLNFFNCLNQERDHALTLKRLKALGFNSIIFDTNTQTIEKDPNGSLHQKVQAFLEFGNDEKLGLKLEVYDPGAGIAYILLP